MIQLSFGFGALEAEFWRWLFAMTRIGAAMLAAPFFGAGNVPPQVRVIATGAIAALVCNWTALAAPPALLSIAGIVVLLGEVLAGLALGFVLQLAFAAPVIAAEVISGAMGMGLASAVDPNSGAHSPALGQYFAVVLTLVFFATGGHLQWTALLVESYRTFPPGAAWLGPERMHEIAGFGAAMFATAARHRPAGNAGAAGGAAGHRCAQPLGPGAQPVCAGAARRHPRGPCRADRVGPADY